MEEMNYLGKIVHRYLPTFAAFASLREIIRVSVAALPRWALRGKENIVRVTIASLAYGK
jgi:hypothetical protein